MSEITLDELMTAYGCGKAKARYGLNGQPKLVRMLSERERHAMGVPIASQTMIPSRYKSLNEMPVYRRPQAKHKYPTDTATIYATTVLRLAKQSDTAQELNAKLCAYHCLDDATLSRAEFRRVIQAALDGKPYYIRRDNPPVL